MTRGYPDYIGESNSGIIVKMSDEHTITVTLPKHDPAILPDGTPIADILEEIKELRAENAKFRDAIRQMKCAHHFHKTIKDLRERLVEIHDKVMADLGYK